MEVVEEQQLDTDDLQGPTSSPESKVCKPSRYTKDPLRGFFLQTVAECAECPHRPTKKFSTHNAWTLHMKTFHKHIKTMAEYKKVHGDPDLVKFRHKCRICDQDMILNLSVVKRHLAAQHGTGLTEYLVKYRHQLEEERRARPVVPASHTLEGWWEGCLYSCRLCAETYSGQLAFENHVSSVHGITGEREVEERYVPEHGRPCSLTRQHQCHLCRKIVRHDYKAIFTHLSKHKMDLETYALQFRPMLEAELRGKGMGYVVERAEKAAGALSVDEYLTKRGQEQSTAPVQDPMDGWADCSEHLCAICGETCWSNLRFHWHVKRVHGMGSTREYRTLHGDPERSLRHHKCQVCGSLIKWEASRIRDHLKFHREPGDKLTIKEYGERFRDYILAEVAKVKGEKAAEEKVGEEAEAGYSAEEWKALRGRKVSPRDRVECELCKKSMNRHSFTRHQEKAHRGILNVRDLARLKRRQTSLAKTGVIRSLGELVEGAGGVVVMKGRGEARQEVDIAQEDMESRLHLYRAGLSLEQIERKVGLIHSGLTITAAGVGEEEGGGVQEEEEEEEDTIEEDGEELVEIETDDAVLTKYPTYIVDEDTGEILFVEEVAVDGGSVETGPGEREETGEDDQGGGPEEGEPVVSDEVEPEMIVGDRLEPELIIGDRLEPELIIGDRLGPEPEPDQGGESLSLWTGEEEEECEEEGDTGPLSGRVMQLVPDTGGSVQVITLGRGEEEALEEEMLESELGGEYVLEGGVLRQVGGREGTWRLEQEQGNLVMLQGEQEAQQDQQVCVQQQEGEGLTEGQYHLVETEEQGGQEAPFLVLQEEGLLVQETEHYIQVVDRGQEKEQEDTSASRLLAPGGWSEQGAGTQEYERRQVSRPEVVGDRVSQGTVVAAWTKMPGARVRVAHSKVVVARAPREGGEVQEDISSPVFHCSGSQEWRDVGSQVAPHKVSGRPTNPTEEQGQAGRVRDFLDRGGVLDRACPGCGKVMSRQRNLVTHLKVIHGVAVTGREGREHDNRYSKENVKMECNICNKVVSRKSIKRHISLCHPEAAQLIQYSQEAKS